MVLPTPTWWSTENIRVPKPIHELSTYTINMSDYEDGRKRKRSLDGSEDIALSLSKKQKAEINAAAAAVVAHHMTFQLLYLLQELWNRPEIIAIAVERTRQMRIQDPGSVSDVRDVTWVVLMEIPLLVMLMLSCLYLP